MPTAENAAVKYESGQNLVSWEALSDTGDRTVFNTVSSLISNKSGFKIDVKPNGVATGGVMTVPASGSNDVVDVAALTCYLTGVSTSVGAGVDVSLTRPGSDVSLVNSVTVNASGGLAVVVGASGATTAFSETRGAAGGPPFVPVTSIEVGQVRLTANAAAPIVASEIKQVVEVHQERYDFPTFQVDRIRTSNKIIGYAGVDFDAAIMANHTGGVGKKVYAQYYTPIFASVPNSSDFVPPETSHSVSSTQIYEKTIASSSESLGQGSFTAYLTDGISDGLISEKNNELWFKFYQDVLDTQYIATQGKLGITRTFPAGDSITAACTISSEIEAKEVVG